MIAIITFMIAIAGITRVRGVCLFAYTTGRRIFGLLGLITFNHFFVGLIIFVSPFYLA